jgi:hypothetical protein
MIFRGPSKMLWCRILPSAIEVSETDLGERIQQLDDEPPAHIVRSMELTLVATPVFRSRWSKVTMAPVTIR